MKMLSTKINRQLPLPVLGREIGDGAAFTESDPRYTGCAMSLRHA